MLVEDATECQQSMAEVLGDAAAAAATAVEPGVNDAAEGAADVSGVAAELNTGADVSVAHADADAVTVEAGAVDDAAAVAANPTGPVNNAAAADAPSQRGDGAAAAAEVLGLLPASKAAAELVPLTEQAWAETLPVVLRHVVSVDGEVLPPPEVGDPASRAENMAESLGITAATALREADNGRHSGAACGECSSGGEGQEAGSSSGAAAVVVKESCAAAARHDLSEAVAPVAGLIADALDDGSEPGDAGKAAVPAAEEAVDGPGLGDVREGCDPSGSANGPVLTEADKGLDPDVDMEAQESEELVVGLMPDAVRQEVEDTGPEGAWEVGTDAAAPQLAVPGPDGHVDGPAPGEATQARNPGDASAGLTAESGLQHEERAEDSAPGIEVKLECDPHGTALEPSATARDLGLRLVVGPLDGSPREGEGDDKEEAGSAAVHGFSAETPPGAGSKAGLVAKPKTGDQDGQEHELHSSPEAPSEADREGTDGSALRGGWVNEHNGTSSPSAVPYRSIALAEAGSASRQIAPTAAAAAVDSPRAGGRRASVKSLSGSSITVSTVARNPVSAVVPVTEPPMPRRGPRLGIRARSRELAGSRGSVGSPDRGRAVPTRGASTVASGAAPREGPSKFHKASRAHRPTDAQLSPHNSSAKPTTYAQLHTARGTDDPVGEQRGFSPAPAEPAQLSSSHLGLALQPVAENTAGVRGPEGLPLLGDAPMGSDDRSASGSGGDRGSAARRRRAPWADPGDELGLISQVEAEAVQLGLEIYARADDGGKSLCDTARKGTGVGNGVEGGDGGEVAEEEESLEAIMAIGRRPSEIAELLLGGARAMASEAVDSDGCIGGDEEVKRRRKQAEKERKRALRQEQKRQQRQRRRALMGLDPYGEDGSGDSSSASSSSSSSSSRRNSGRSKSRQSHSPDKGNGGEIRTAYSRALVLLSAVTSVAHGAFDMPCGGDGGGGGAAAVNENSGGLGENLHAEGRILTSASVAAALGLGLIFAPSQEAATLLTRRGDSGTDRDASGFVPSYLLDTPPPEPRASDGMTFQPRPGSDYAPSLAPTIATSDGSSTLLRIADDGEPPPPLEGGGSGGGSSKGGGAASSRAITTGFVCEDDSQFLAARDERSRKIAEQLAALQEESRLLQQQSILLQERTREISRSVGLPTPPPLATASGAAAITPGTQSPRAHAPAAHEPAVPEALPMVETGELAGAASAVAVAAARVPQLRHCSPSAGGSAPVAASLANPPAQLESRPGSILDTLGTSPLCQQPATISWALPKHNPKPIMNQGLTAAAVSSPLRAFPSPPKCARRQYDAQAHARALGQEQGQMQRLGSTSSLTDSLLPRWAEQMESPVLTPDDGHSKPHPQSVLPTISPRLPALPFYRRVEGEQLPPPPPSLLQYVPKGQAGGIPAAPAVAAVAGQIPGQVKSRLGAAAAATPGAQQHGPTIPQAKAVVGLKPPQSSVHNLASQSHLCPRPLQSARDMPALAAPLEAPQLPYQSMLAPGMPASVWASTEPPMGLPLQPLMPSMGLPLAPGTSLSGVGALLPPFPIMTSPPAATAAAYALAAQAPVPTLATKQNAGSKGPTRLAKPPKAPASMNAGPSPSAGAGSGVAAEAAAASGVSTSGGPDGGHGSLGMGPPPWLQGPGPGMPMAPPGVVPMLMPQQFGGMLEQMGSVGPWMALPPGVLPPVAVTTLTTGTSPKAGGGGGIVASAAVASRKEITASPGRGRSHGAAPPKRANDYAAASRAAPGSPAEPYLGPVAGGLPGSMGMVAPPGFMGYNIGAPGDMTVPLMPGTHAGVSGIMGGGSFQNQLGSMLSTQLVGVLPPVKLQGGKGKMSRSAPPGSYSAAKGSAAAGMPTPASSAGAAVEGHPSGFDGLGLGLPMAAWLGPAMAPPMYGVVPGPAPSQYMCCAAGAVVAGGHSPEAAAIVQRADMVQQQQMERYREIESNLVDKLDRQRHQLQQQAGPGGRARDQRRNSHDGRPVFRLF